jgi:chromate reductase
MTQTPSRAKDMKEELRTLRLLALSGSLRAASTNTILLRAAAMLAPEGVEINVYGSLGNLPHFNPDLEATAPLTVKDFWAQVRASDGMLISTPEYAHGIPGVLKNALDWLVGDDAFSGKPVALLNASPRATYAQASLTEILAVMSARIVPEASITLSLLDKHLDEAAIVSQPAIANMIRTALVTFARVLAHR